jgi:hypothetical protein
MTKTDIESLPKSAFCHFLLAVGHLISEIAYLEIFGEVNQGGVRQLEDLRGFYRATKRFTVIKTICLQVVTHIDKFDSLRFPFGLS